MRNTVKAVNIMQEPKYKPFIDALLAFTKKNPEQWMKVKGVSNQFYINPTGEQKILIDKYVGVQDEVTIPCVNLTIFDNENNLIDEVVLCDVESYKENYDSLNQIYTIVENKFKNELGETINPILSHITESINRKLGVVH
jgi:hypothetical protein